MVTLGLLFALKGVGNRAFYRWLKRDYVPLFPKLPVRTRLFRLFNSHRKWIDHFMADPTMMSVIDTYGIELIHPCREGRSPKQIGCKGKSNSRFSRCNCTRLLKLLNLLSPTRRKSTCPIVATIRRHSGK